MSRGVSSCIKFKPNHESLHQYKESNGGTNIIRCGISFGFMEEFQEECHFLCRLLHYLSSLEADV